MPALGSKINVLLIRSWIHPLAPLRAALHDAAIDARFTRIDIEPALNAALARGGFGTGDDGDLGQQLRPERALALFDAAALRASAAPSRCSGRPRRTARAGSSRSRRAVR